MTNNSSGQQIGFLLAECARLIRRNMNRRVKPLGMTQEQWRTLFQLSKAQGITQVALAERLEVQPVSLARILDRLQENGLVERRVCATDRRAFELYLTDAAAPQLAELAALGRATRRDALAGLDAASVRQLASLLETVKNNLGRAEGNGHE